jgi:tRNA threonylcarbamoyl adenosine modification protein YeaZ
VLVLAFDTSTSAVTVAVVPADGEPPAQRVVVEANRHGELLAPLIRAALDDAGADPAALAAIGVGLGPGPFTGLRVGIVTAKAMSDALGIPAYGVCSLDLIADQHRLAGLPYAVLSDARRKQVYWAAYGADGHRLEGPELGRPDDVADLLRGRVSFVAGAGAHLYRDAFTGFDVAEAGCYPGAVELGRRGIDSVREGAPVVDLVPMYLRRPDAQPPGRPKQVTPA